MGATSAAQAELERRNTFLQLLQVVSVAANGGPTSVAAALQSTLDEVCRLTAWTIGHVLLPDHHDGEVLVSSGVWHTDDPAQLAGVRRRHEGATFAAGHGVPGRVFRSGVPEQIADVGALSADDADRVRCSLIDEERMRAVAAFPVLVGDEVCGVLEFFSPSPFAADTVLLEVMAQVGLVLGRVVERSRYEAALRDAREVAEVALVGRSDFLTRMSHELRTPLTAVLGYTDLLALTTLSEQQRRYIVAIERGGDHLAALVSDMLDVTHDITHDVA